MYLNSVDSMDFRTEGFVASNLQHMVSCSCCVTGLKEKHAIRPFAYLLTGGWGFITKWVDNLRTYLEMLSQKQKWNLISVPNTCQTQDRMLWVRGSVLPQRNHRACWRHLPGDRCLGWTHVGQSLRALQTRESPSVVHVIYIGTSFGAC